MTARAARGNGVSVLPDLEGEIRALLDSRPRIRATDRRLADAYRTILRTYENEVRGLNRAEIQSGSRKIDYRKKLTELAREAYLFLGGQADPCSLSLKDYDHRRYGPYLGVSDEGSASLAIREAAARTPKARILKTTEPITVGLSLDAERLGAVGEVPVGPEEYAEIFLQTVGRILTSTNVGTRLNLRHYKRFPLVTVSGGAPDQALKAAVKGLRDAFRPFFETPDGKPRSLTVYIEFDRRTRRSVAQRIALLKALAAEAANGGFADPRFHHLGFQIRIGYGIKGRNAALLGVDMTAEAGLRRLAVDGVARKKSVEFISLPGLLQYLPPGLLGPVLRAAADRSVSIHPVSMVDTETVARNVWSSLNTARHMGLALGKFGTFPLTLEETDAVVGRVQKWFDDWTAAPVFFIDQGILSRKKVYTSGDTVAGIKEWLRMIARHHVPVVLIDTLDKSKGYRLLRSKTEPKGLLGPVQIRKIDALAAELGVKTLWAGGITLPQVFEFGKMGVFGIYVTTAVASSNPVSKAYRKDPLLAAEKEPTREGVFRTKLLLEAGFLASQPAVTALAGDLETDAARFVEAIVDKKPTEEIQKRENALIRLAESCWRILHPPKNPAR